MNDEHTHRYGDSEDTTALPHGVAGAASSERHDTGVIPPFSVMTSPPPAPSSGRSRGRTAGVLLAALLLGTAGGVGGAAAWDALGEDETGVTTPSVSTASASTDPSPLAQASSGNAAAREGSAEAVAAAVLPSVVKINVSGSEGAGSGSGIILSADGEILTNNHVAEVAGDSGSLSVSLSDGTTADARIVGTDPVTDLAVIRAEDVSGLTPATIGDSEALDVGENVVAIGSPFGLEATVTSGIVSSLNRPVSVGPNSSGTDTIYPAIQTDAAINPGNSGGPLTNLSGEVVGINSSIRTSTSSSAQEGGSIGLGFAIPISKVLPIVEQLRAGETPTHARLGVTASSQPNADGTVEGATLESIEDGSAGSAAGLESGDVVTKIDDERISTVDGLVATIRGYRPGDEVTIEFQRDGETRTTTATLDSDVETEDG